MLAEKVFAADDDFGMFGERPNPANALVEYPPDPEADGVTHNRAERRPPEHRPEFQMPQADERAQGEHDQGAGDNDADDSERLEHGCGENHCAHPAGMGGDPCE